jgi:hypothetical protein
MDKTNTSCHTYNALNSCGIGNLSRICISIFLDRPEVSHHYLDHLVEGHCWLPYVFASPTETTKAPALYYPLFVISMCICFFPHDMLLYHLVVGSNTFCNSVKVVSSNTFQFTSGVDFSVIRHPSS